MTQLKPKFLVRNTSWNTIWKMHFPQEKQIKTWKWKRTIENESKWRRCWNSLLTYLVVLITVQMMDLKMMLVIILLALCQITEEIAQFGVLWCIKTNYYNKYNQKCCTESYFYCFCVSYNFWSAISGTSW